MSKKFSKNLIPLIIVSILIIAGVIVLTTKTKESPKESPLDIFAKCLNEKGVKFYGAYWCGHCKNQQELFGDSAKYLPYIECWDTNKNQLNSQCREAKIEAFPTWEFAEGKREMGELSIEKLSGLSGCRL